MYMIVCETYDNTNNDERYYTEYVGVCMDDEVEYVMEDLSIAHEHEYGNDTYVKWGNNYCEVKYIANDTLWKSTYFYGVDIEDGRYVVMSTIDVGHIDRNTDLVYSTDAIRDAYDAVYKEYLNNTKRPNWPFYYNSLPKFTGWDEVSCEDGHASLVNSTYVIDIKVIDIRDNDDVYVINY